MSARNRLTGIVTKVTKDTVMAQVELICGPYRMVSLMSSEAADELGLEPGVRAIASVKSTNVVVERPVRAPVRQPLVTWPCSPSPSRWPPAAAAHDARRHAAARRPPPSRCWPPPR